MTIINKKELIHNIEESTINRALKIGVITSIFMIITTVSLLTWGFTRVAPPSWWIFGTAMIFFSGITAYIIFVYQQKISQLVERFDETATKLEKSKSALSHEKKQTANFIESLPGLFFLYNSEMKLTKWNKNHILNTGYSSEEVSRMTPSDWFYEEDWPAVEKAIRLILNTGSGSIKTFLKIKNGSRIPYYLTAKSIEVDGKLGFCGHGINISEQQALEEQIRQNHKMDALGALAGGIAHDFNNILNGFYGFIQIIERAKTEEKRNKYLKEFNKLVDRAKDLVTQILSFSRRQEYKHEVIDLRNIVRELNQFLRASIPATIKQVYSIPKEPVRVLGDATQIHQILLNLCTNAYYEMQESGGQLTIKISTISIGPSSSLVISDVLAAGEYAKIEVIDTGTGIPSDIQEKIFEPFFTTKEEGKGTGMGLSVVHRIARDHGGNIDFKSIVGQGTTFIIHIPLTEETVINYNAKENEKVISLHREKLLFVDDEDAIRKIFHDYLGSLGYKVTCCSNGQEALDTFIQFDKKFDMIISDFIMPEMVGTELATAIRATGYTRPILLLSGFHNDELPTEKLEKAGVTDCLFKPMQPVSLAEKIKEHLK